MPGKHLVYLARGVLPREYVLQVQGQLWVTGREWCDFMSFHPDLPPFVIARRAGPAMQAALDAAFPAFVGKMLRIPRAPHCRLRPPGVERGTGRAHRAALHARGRPLAGRGRVEGWCVTLRARERACAAGLAGGGCAVTPCAVSWCCALAKPRGKYCTVHASKSARDLRALYGQRKRCPACIGAGDADQLFCEMCDGSQWVST